MKKIVFCAWACLLLVVGTTSVYADRGSISFVPNAKIYEPTQRALIAFNGKEEILALTTDLYASEATKVLEVMPFPAEPKVEQAEMFLFVRATHLFNRGNREFIPGSDGAFGMRKGGVGAEPPAGEITFHERIGAHDISVARVNDAAGFVEWVNRYLKNAGVDNTVIPPVMTKNVEEYLADGFTWFVFDVVSLDATPKTNDAIQYRFKTDKVFYPLRISRTGEGQTSIDVFMLKRPGNSTFLGISEQRVKVLRTIMLDGWMLDYLGEDFVGLFKGIKDVAASLWQIQGDLRSFDKDLIVKVETPKDAQETKTKKSKAGKKNKYRERERR